MKKLMMGLVLGLLANTAWAGNAAYCIQLVHPDGGNALKNICSEVVEASWNADGADHLNSSWTIQPGQSMPISLRQGQWVNWDACKGANSIQGSSTPMTVSCK